LVRVVALLKAACLLTLNAPSGGNGHLVHSSIGLYEYTA